MSASFMQPPAAAIPRVSATEADMGRARQWAEADRREAAAERAAEGEEKEYSSLPLAELPEEELRERNRAAHQRGAPDDVKQALRAELDRREADRREEARRNATPNPDRLISFVLNFDAQSRAVDALCESKDDKKAQSVAERVDREARAAATLLQRVGFTVSLMSNHDHQEHLRWMTHMWVCAVVPDDTDARKWEWCILKLALGENGGRFPGVTTELPGHYFGSLVDALRDTEDGVYLSEPGDEDCGRWFAIPEHLQQDRDNITTAELAALLSLKFTAAEALDVLEGCGRNPMAAAAMLSLKVPQRSPKGGSCAVDGLLIAGAVNVLAGDGEVGKSSLMLDLADAMASGATEWAGLAIPEECRSKAVVYLGAEDGIGLLAYRLGELSASRSPGRPRIIVPIWSNDASLDEALATVRAIPKVGLLVVDPAITWLNGCGRKDSDNDDVSWFLERLRAVAEEKGCAVVVIHHTRKENPPPRSTREVLERVRGAVVWSQRPRVVLALWRARGGGVVMGVAKSNAHHLVPKQDHRLSFDTNTGRFDRAENARPAAAKGREAEAADAPPNGAASVSPDAEAATAAIVRLVGAGELVTASGKRSLYERHQYRPASVPEVAGWVRSRCERAVAEAMAAGLIVNGGKSDGLRST